MDIFSKKIAISDRLRNNDQATLYQPFTRKGLIKGLTRDSLMITIDITPTVKLQATVGTWRGVAESLGVSTQTLFGYRKALDLMGKPITPELTEELRRLSTLG